MPDPFDGSMSVALVIPAHNESAHIEGVISSLPSWVDRVIVVDDCSTDDTAERVARIGDPRVRPVRHEVNKGVGAAMATGYRAAMDEGFDLVGKMDADGQMLASELPDLVEPFALGLADYTKGNRFYFAGASIGMPPHRSFGNTLLSFMTKFASGYWHVYDSQCGFTMIRAAYLDLIDLDALPDDYFFENAMLIKLNALDARVVDVPTSTVYGEEVSGVSVRRVALTFPPRLMLAGGRRFWRKHLVTDFSPIGGLTMVGLSLAAFGVLFGAYHWVLSSASGVAATTGTVMIAVLPLILAFQLLIQAFSMSVLSSSGAEETAQYARILMSRRRHKA